MVIHTQNCRNVAEHLKQPEKLIDVEWGSSVEGEFPVEIRVQAANERGVLATVAAAISDAGANIQNVDIEDRDGLYSSMTFLIDVADRQDLAQVMRRIRPIRFVNRIFRTRS